MSDELADRPESMPGGGAGIDVPKPNTSAVRRSKRAGIGGTFSHGPLCKCNPCKARRRQQEAIAIAAGIGRMELDSKPIQPPVSLDKNGHKKTAPKGLRERIAQYIHYSMVYPNSAKADIAEKMGISAATLYKIITDAQAQGLIKFTDPLERIDYEIIPKIVDNLNHFLDAKDKTVTIEAAKGTLFKSYQESRGISDGNQTVLALKIEMPDGQDVKILTGHIVGKPKSLSEAEDNLTIDVEAYEIPS